MPINFQEQQPNSSNDHMTDRKYAHTIERQSLTLWNELDYLVLNKCDILIFEIGCLTKANVSYLNSNQNQSTGHKNNNEHSEMNS